MLQEAKEIQEAQQSIMINGDESVSYRKIINLGEFSIKWHFIYTFKNIKLKIQEIKIFRQSILLEKQEYVDSCKTQDSRSSLTRLANLPVPQHYGVHTGS